VARIQGITFILIQVQLEVHISILAEQLVFINKKKHISAWCELPDIATDLDLYQHPIIKIRAAILATPKGDLIVMGFGS
jgi:hypothetical protein